MFDALSRAGITTITVEFDGEGDSGQIESVSALAGDAPATLPQRAIPLLQVRWHDSTATPVKTKFYEAIEHLCYNFLSQEHGGWENDGGAFGTFTFDVTARTIELEFNRRFTDIFTTPTTFNRGHHGASLPPFLKLRSRLGWDRGRLPSHPRLVR